MRLATLRSGRGTRAVRLEESEAVDLGFADVGELLRADDWRELAGRVDGPRRPLEGLDYAPVVPRPEKVICVGLNYRTHILEMGRELPRHPTLFAKYARSLIGAYDDIALPAGSDAIDWEAELGVVVGTELRHADEQQARQAIAGFTVVNDVTARDWQNRTTQWLQGKTFEGTTPVGPWLVTDGADHERPSYQLSCQIDGETVQAADTADLVFGPAALLSYLSTIITLSPGDLIATGTPGGVGHARRPPRYLSDGVVMRTRIEGVGECRNTCRTAVAAKLVAAGPE
ncbi:MAG: 2-hydroxyhepta-2,4-diene-1,7-dioate isomerase [Pseudonocardiales bacterium]|nr:MAG: 2-hydroxyhepta-2,4-diene-1,7-dioate isomerase [Pseudonocardiales bacterium]